MEAVIVPCTKEKIWCEKPDAGEVAAKDAYTYPPFLKWRDYAEKMVGANWFILSTKYGLIKHDKLIEKYEVPIEDVKGCQEFKDKIKKQAGELGFGELKKVTLVCCGKNSSKSDFADLAQLTISGSEEKCGFKDGCCDTYGG